jgi:hypothetical protein
VTQWVGDSGTGRARGPTALARAWIDVLVRPREFFETTLAPGDQAPGLLFLAAVVLVEEAIRLILVVDAFPVFAGRPILSAVVWLLIVVVFVAPIGTHLVAALQTLLLLLVQDDRGGVSETVQVLCYATAPCVLAGLPLPWLRAGVVLYGAGLYLLGIGVVHGLDPFRSVITGALPAALVFGVGFRGFAAIAATFRFGTSALGALAP